MESIKDAVKPPFANYDMVVYFGGGLFCIPFINRYIVEPLSFRWPSFKIAISSEIAQEAVSILSSLFFIYIAGHIVAYLASQLVEKAVDRTFGKISTTIIFATEWNSTSRNGTIRSLIKYRLKNIPKESALLASIIRFGFHVPAVPSYILIYFFGIFGYFETRLPKPVLDSARKKISNIGLGDIDLTIKSKWYKILEYYVINRSPQAVPRMYNYLIISGLFRSLCFIFLSSMWLLIYYLIHFERDADWFIKSMLGSSRSHMGLVEFIGLSCIYVFCLFSYIKFQRRYAEEAIFAFVYCDK